MNLKKIKKLIQKTNSVQFSFLTAAAIIMAAAMGADWSIRSLISSSHWVEHTAEVEYNIKALQAELMTAQTNMRGYYFSQQKYYYKKYLQSASMIPQSFNKVRKLVNDNPKQRLRMDLLDPLIKARLHRWEDCYVILNEKGLSAVIKILAGDEGKQLDQRILRTTTEMILEEENLMVERTNHSRKLGYQTMAVILLACYTSILLIIWAYTRVRKDMRLRKITEQHFRRIFDFSPNGIVVSNIQGELIQINAAFCKMFGYTPDELIGKTTSDFTPAEDKLVGLRQINRLIKNKEKTVNFEKRYRHKEGHLVHALLSSTLLSTEANKDPMVLGVVIDMTDRVKTSMELMRSKQEAIEAARVKSQFLANMSHEIRTPLNGIIGMSNLLMETTLDLVQHKYAKIIQDSGNGLLTIINDILDFSKVEAGKLTIENLDFDLKSLIEGHIELLRPKAVEKNISLKLFVDSNIPKIIRGDAGRLGQIILNLLGNAIKFTAEGEVSIRIVPEKTQERLVNLRFEVKDSGIGLSEKDQKNLFQPFTQADSSTARKYGGTGLGLSISKRLAELMNGEIGVESEEGKGSTFWFTAKLLKGLDIVEDTNVYKLAPVKKIKTPSTSENIRILLAEDNAVNQLLAKTMLQKMGYSVHVVANGKEVLEALIHTKYDLILMDCQMPEMDGFEATHAIRLAESPKSEHIPIVALTANALKEDEEKCLAAGMDGYLSKPIKKEALEEAISHWLDHKKKIA